MSTEKAVHGDGVIYVYCGQVDREGVGLGERFERSNCKSICVAADMEDSAKVNDEAGPVVVDGELEIGSFEGYNRRGS